MLACPITSEVAEKLPIRPIIEAAESNGLRIRSQIMTDRMLAVPRDRVRQVVGIIDARTGDSLDSALLLVLWPCALAAILLHHDRGVAHAFPLHQAE